MYTQKYGETWWPWNSCQLTWSYCLTESDSWRGLQLYCPGAPDGCSDCAAGKQVETPESRKSSCCWDFHANCLPSVSIGWAWLAEMRRNCDPGHFGCCSYWWWKRLDSPAMWTGNFRWLEEDQPDRVPAAQSVVALALNYFLLFRSCKKNWLLSTKNCHRVKILLFIFLRWLSFVGLLFWCCSWGQSDFIQGLGCATCGCPRRTIAHGFRPTHLGLKGLRVCLWLQQISPAQLSTLWITLRSMMSAFVFVFLFWTFKELVVHVQLRSHPLDKFKGQIHRNQGHSRVEIKAKIFNHFHSIINKENLRNFYLTYFFEI